MRINQLSIEAKIARLEDELKSLKSQQIKEPEFDGEFFVIDRAQLKIKGEFHKPYKTLRNYGDGNTRVITNTSKTIPIKREDVDAFCEELLKVLALYFDIKDKKGSIKDE